jgi:hypothetical protein
MAFPASHSMVIRKTDGLLARVGELCGIIRASYLSPFFPLSLSFELWRYLRPRLQTGSLTRNNRLSLRLLRGAAFGVTLTLPAKGWAQADGTPARTSETAAEVLKRESTTVWCKRDNGNGGPNYANVLGNFISGGISNAYYPAADQGVEQTLDEALPSLRKV